MNHGLLSCCSPIISILRSFHYKHDAPSLKEKMEKCRLICIQFTDLQIKSELFLLSYVGGGFIMPQHEQRTYIF